LLPALPWLRDGCSCSSLKGLTLPPGVVDKTFWDDEIGGFGLRLRAGGSARWVVQYDVAGKARRVTLGTTALLSAGDARTKAKDLLARVRLGSDPAAEKRAARARATETFGAMLPRYLADRKHNCRTKTWEQIERRLDKLARPLHPLPLSNIDRRTLADLFTAVAADRGRSAATNLHGTLTGYFSWLMGAGLLDANPIQHVTNPIQHVNRPTPLPGREYLPTEDELRSTWLALGDDDYGNIVKLIILCGSRRSEIGDLKWREVNFVSGVLNIPAGRMKAGKAFLIPLSPPAWIFSDAGVRGRARIFFAPSVSRRISHANCRIGSGASCCARNSSAPM
jgi:integrase